MFGGIIFSISVKTRVHDNDLRKKRSFRNCDWSAMSRFWGWFSVGDLFLLNFLTIVTEFIGVSLAMSYFGVSPYVSVPVAAAMLVAITASGSFRRWERFMFVFIFANFLVIPLAVQSHPSASAFFHGLTVPGVTGRLTQTA